MGLPTDRPAGSQWALVVGWQWVRPANQRITGVGERCSSPLELGGGPPRQGAFILRCPAFWAALASVFMNTSPYISSPVQAVHGYVAANEREAMAAYLQLIRAMRRGYCMRA